MATVFVVTPNSPTALVRQRLSAAGDPERAVRMAAYMRTSMPFYGVMTSERRMILKELVAAFPPKSHAEYVDVVSALWGGAHREEKYLAVAYAQHFPAYIDGRSVPLYERLIVEGAWWDFVDDVAAHLVGAVLRTERTPTTPIVRMWIGDDDMWVRRTSIICQLRHRAETDTGLLADACLHNVADRAFFIRKAIGWALREYAKTNPDWVVAFVERHRDHMAGLSVREAMKHL